MFHNYKLRPMLLWEKSKIFQDSNYLYEIKFDGFRAFIYVSRKKFVILSRNGNDVTKKYPELSEMQKIVGEHEVIFDGEIITTLNGLPNFSLLQKRSRSKKITDKIMEDIPVSFIAFDILYDNKDLTKNSLAKRKEYLNHYEDTLYFIKSKVYFDGKALFKLIKKVGLEGVVAKFKKSQYFCGERTKEWVKIKNIKVDQFLVHGYQEKTNTFTLFLGEYRNQQFYFVGKVSVHKKHELIDQLKRLKKTENMFINLDEKAFYVFPKIEVRVHYLEKSKAGILRHAVLEY
ncbi:putative uncharacterized protein [Mycoplasma sp. CAG:776]|nr:putative uncharacterized protein [Mycoplasma sp. CAG:776]